MPFSNVMSLNLGIGLGSAISIPNPPNPEPEKISYALNNDSYSYAQMDSEVTLPDDGIFSFYMIPDESSGVNYILRSSTGVAYIYYRQSDGRLRMKTDDDQTFTFSVTGLSLVTPTKITIRLLPENGVELYINDQYIITPLGPHTTFTVDRIGEGVTTFGVSIGNSVSYPMLTENIGETNTSDMIGGNNLTYVDLVDPLTADNYKEVKGDY